jgi:hypothetical protein
MQEVIQPYVCNSVNRNIRVYCLHFGAYWFSLIVGYQRTNAMIQK